VLRVGQKLCRIREFDGADREATLAGALQRGERSSLAVGDEVIVAGEAPAIRLLRVLPRRSALERPDPHAPGRRLVVAANIDLVVIVLAARTPPPRPRLVDRYLVAAGLGGAAALLCVNKSDQLDAEGRHALGALLEPYPPLGVPVLWCSAHTGEGLAQLRASIEGRTCAFVGHSGVGKSSLINALDPALDLATGEANPFHGKGRHTTTSATLHDLGGNTRIIDTPGVRAFGLQGLRSADLGPWFPDLQALAAGCAWRDCSHAGEAGCAVAEAASAGRVDPRRLDSYRRILASLADADEPA
jgi:ribosome biogenesis GTPase